MGTSEDNLESPVLYDNRPVLSSPRRSVSIPGSLVSKRHSSQDSESITKNKHKKVEREIQFMKDFSSSQPNSPKATKSRLDENNGQKSDKFNESVHISLTDD